MDYEANQKIAELEERLRILIAANRELQSQVEAFTPRVFFVATLKSGQPLYWVEA
jgi:hypothetical protein